MSSLFSKSLATKRIRLGESLVAKGIISAEKLPEYLEKAKEAKQRLGDYLTGLGLVSEEMVADIVCANSGTIRYTPDRFKIEPAMASHLHIRSAQLYKAVPVELRNGLLYVCMLDPLNTELLDTIEELTGYDVEPVFCLQQEFSAVFALVYGKYTGISGAVEKLKDDESQVELVQNRDEDISDTGAPNEAPIIRMVNAIISQGVREGASDIHISPKKDAIEVRFRIDGLLRDISTMPSHTGPSLVSRIKILASMDISLTRVPQDGRFTVLVDGREINLRISTLPTIYGENVVMRLLDMSSKKIYTLDQLGMDDRDRTLIDRYIRKPYGMILSTGPTGSGKSTSLYSILQLINRADINTITLEDPVEYRLDGVRQVQLNQRAGMTFASGLRSILRQDPDVIMVGEIRDSETAQIATQAALTGHLVLSTLHTNDSTGAVSRLMDMGIEPFLVSSVLLCSFAQRLVRTVCPHCREEYRPAPALLRMLGLPEDMTYYHGSGCTYCGNTGYLGRTAIFEIMPMNDDLQSAISSKANMGELRRIAAAAGMRSLIENALDKIRLGITTPEETARVAMI